MSKTETTIVPDMVADVVSKLDNYCASITSDDRTVANMRFAVIDFAFNCRLITWDCYNDLLAKYNVL